MRSEALTVAANLHGSRLTKENIMNAQNVQEQLERLLAEMETVMRKFVHGDKERLAYFEKKRGRSLEAEKCLCARFEMESSNPLSQRFTERKQRVWDAKFEATRKKRKLQGNVPDRKLSCLDFVFTFICEFLSFADLRELRKVNFVVLMQASRELYKRTIKLFKIPGFELEAEWEDGECEREWKATLQAKSIPTKEELLDEALSDLLVIDPGRDIDDEFDEDVARTLLINKGEVDVIDFVDDKKGWDEAGWNVSFSYRSLSSIQTTQEAVDDIMEDIICLSNDRVPDAFTTILDIVFGCLLAAKWLANDQDLYVASIIVAKHALDCRHVEYPSTQQKTFLALTLQDLTLVLTYSSGRANL